MPTDPILIPKVGGESTLAGCCSTQVAPSYQHSLALGQGCKQSCRRDCTSAQKQEQPTFPKPHLLLCWHSGLRAGDTPRGSRRPGAGTQPFLVLGSARCPLHQTTAGLATGCLLPFFFPGGFYGLLHLSHSQQEEHVCRGLTHPKQEEPGPGAQTGSRPAPSREAHPWGAVPQGHPACTLLGC